MPRLFPKFEQLEARVVLDCSAALTGDVHYEPSEWIKEWPNDVISFASLRVGERIDTNEILDDSDIVDVGKVELNMAQVKGYLHLFADSIGTDLIIETQDLRFSDWGGGSGSTTQRFVAFVNQNLDLVTVEECTGLRFAGDVDFQTPGEGGEFFTGGFLDLRIDSFSSLLRSGDIAEIVDGYELSTKNGEGTLVVDAQLGEMVFTINEDKTLTDEFDRIWTSNDPYEIIDPNAVDELVGDISGNGTVDFEDFLILSIQFGTDAAESDLDGSGEVDFADFLVLSANFGKSLNG